MAKKSYTLETDVVTEMPDAFGERYTRKFSAGTVTAKSEQDEYALDHLVRLGHAKEKSATARKDEE